MKSLQACHCCGLVQRVPPVPAELVAVCARCGTRFRPPDAGRRAAGRTAAAALGAFFLFWPAVLLPILEVEQLGRTHAASVLVGTLTMLRQGEWFVGGVVLLFSVVFPLVKIVLLLELSLVRLLGRRQRAATYRLMEHAGRWSMLDVLLLALLVMLVKVGSVVEFRVGPGAAAFVLCVAMSMLASLSFDPHQIWEDES
jgi:paraquat-inducible protein A